MGVVGRGVGRGGLAVYGGRDVGGVGNSASPRRASSQEALSRRQGSVAGEAVLQAGGRRKWRG